MFGIAGSCDHFEYIDDGFCNRVRFCGGWITDEE